MELVVDTNILLAGVLKPGITQKLLLSEELVLLAPDHCQQEVEKYSDEFAKRMGKSRKEFNSSMALIFSEVRVLPEQEYKYLKKHAMELLGGNEDWPFMALAMAKQAPIWSNDKAFKKQSKVKIFTTKELAEFLGKKQKQFF